MNLLLALSIAILACTVCAQLTFSGNVETDFDSASSNYTIVTIEDMGKQDIVLPSQLQAAGLSVSGWDIKDIRFQFDPAADQLNVGINCFGICGDADGDGDPGGASPALIERGGTDLPAFGKSETVLVAFDLGGVFSDEPDGKMDFILGYPSPQATDSDPLPCGGPTFDISCFGLFQYSGTSLEAPQTHFLYSSGSGVLPHPAFDHNPSTSAAKPDLEWSIGSFNLLRAKSNWGRVNNTKTWYFNTLAYMGSLQDDGIAEDFFPAANAMARVEFCASPDVCGVCDGDGTTCLDCMGTPNGSFQYDQCDVCGGDGRGCGVDETDATGLMSRLTSPVFVFAALLWLAKH